MWLYLNLGWNGVGNPLKWRIPFSYASALFDFLNMTQSYLIMH